MTTDPQPRKGTKGPMVKGRARAFYGDVELVVATDGHLVRIELGESNPASRYLHADDAEAFGHLLLDAAKVVRKRVPR